MRENQINLRFSGFEILRDKNDPDRFVGFIVDKEGNRVFMFRELLMFPGDSCSFTFSESEFVWEIQTNQC